MKKILCVVCSIVMIILFVACGSSKVKLDDTLLQAINQATEESFADMLLAYEWDEDEGTYYITIAMEGFDTKDKIVAYDLDESINEITKNFSDSFNVRCCLGVFDYSTKQTLIYASVDGEEVKS